MLSLRRGTDRTCTRMFSITPTDRVNGQNPIVLSGRTETVAQHPADKHDAPTETPAGSPAKTSLRIKRPRQLRMFRRIPMAFILKLMAFLTAMVPVLSRVLEILKILLELAAKAASRYLGL